MEGNFVFQLKDLGIASILGLSALGSALGAGVAAMSAIGTWKRAFLQSKPASFMLVAFVGAPLTQTIYGMIVMNKMLEISSKLGVYLLNIGLFCGLAMGISAYMQGKAAAVACDAFGETNKGFANFIVVLGIIETVALFVMAFSLGILGRLAI
ncbi:MAG: V-type ATP synthase subunit K [Candidatus Omnitrophica bacterium]|nr:V-type ATP synthase subunit K [Candidatus Omnitrophota bacterium]